MKLHPRLLAEARPSRAAILFSISMGLVGGVLAIFQARQISMLISQVFLGGKGFESISRLLGIILVIMLLRAAAGYAGERSANAGARLIKNSLRQRLYAHIVALGPAYLRRDSEEGETRTGELANTAIEGVEALEIYYSQYLPQVALAALIPLMLLVFIFPTDFLSGIIMLVTAPLLPLFMYLIGSNAQVLTHKQWRGLGRMSAYFLDVLQGLTTLKSLGRSREQAEVINRVSENYRKTTMSVLKVTFLSALALELIATLSTAVVAVEIGVRLLYGRLAFDQAFFILLLAPEFYLPLRLLGTRFHAGMAGVQAAKRIFEILDIPAPVYASSSSTSHLTSKHETIPPAIELRGIRFAYPNHGAALQDISLAIPAGKMTALVGESGAGKTTLTWLLLRFLFPDEGEIFVNGLPLSKIPIQDWRNSLAWVPQNPYLFNDSVAVNIRLACPEATEADIQRAAALAHADQFIRQLPNGYATVIGERGARLSTGQAQRIALARAFLKDAPLLILDEATSHLDPQTDALLQESLLRLKTGRTVLLIAHRRSTADAADQVVTMSHGKVVHIQKNSRTAHTDHAEQISALMQQPSSGQVHLPGMEQVSLDALPQKAPSVEKRLIRLLTPFAGRITLSILLGFATIASSIGLMAAAAYIISAAALHPSIAELQLAIVGVRFFGLSRGVFRYLERLVSHDVTLRLLAKWRLWFYQTLEPLAPARLMQFHSGDLLSRAINDISTLENFYVLGFLPPMIAVLVSIASVAFIGDFSPILAAGLALFLLLAGIGLPALTFWLSRRIGPQLIRKRASLSTAFIDGVQGLPDLLTLGRPEIQLNRLHEAGTQLTRLQAKMSAFTALQNALGSLLANLAMLTVLALAVVEVTLGRLDGVLLGTLALAALASFEAISTLPLAAQSIETNREAAQRLYELVDAQAAVIDPLQPLPLRKGFDLIVDGMSFRYPSSDIGEKTDFTLNNISFSLPAGKHIAIVGPSGAGKTTLLNILQRFWEYQLGSILLDGKELRCYRSEDIRKRIALISPSTYIFAASIRENMLIARPEATSQEASVAEQAAQLQELVSSLPNGNNTQVGEHGMRLSAGERQRLAIARAMLRDADLLLLDEPVANLDPATAQAVLGSIRELSIGKSMISITQHMLGMESMDEILVLVDGTIAERGTHHELLAMEGIYHQMWRQYHQII